MGRTEKFVLITGCSPGGIGFEMCKTMAAAGFKVLATARNKDSIAALSNQGIQPLSLELNSVDSIEKLYKEVEKITDGQLDVLINNAGRNYTVPALDLDFDEVNDVFMTNTIAVMRMCQRFSPLLIAAKGRIVQIGSAAGLIPYPFSSTYNASKAAMHAYSETLRVELEPFGVDVIVVFAGRVKSRLARYQRSLKPDSRYLAIQDEYTQRVEHSPQDAMSAEAFAKSVTAQIIRPNASFWIWEGTQSWMVWFLNAFMSRARLHATFASQYGLGRLKSENVGKGK